MATYQHSLPTCTQSQTRPGFTAFLVGLPARIVRLAREYAVRRQERHAFLTIARLDDRMLADVGLSRSDVESAANLPLTINASQAVQQIAADRRAEERYVRRH